MSLAGAPSPRSGHVAVWTGSETIVFGGDDAVPSEDDGPLPAAGRARAEARRDRGLDRDAWSAFSATAMLDRLLVFTGSELLLFSGFDGTNLAPEGERIPVPIEAVPR